MPTPRTLPLVSILSTLIVAATLEPALAHHAMGGDTPKTLWHGLLSGLAHPVIGPDHLAFIVAIGIAAGLIGQGSMSLIIAFVAASSAGVLAHLAKLNLPLSETLVALSVVAAGLLLLLGASQRQPQWLPLAAVAGLLHGYAFGEAVVGAEQSVIGAYLVGIALIATLIAWAFSHLTRQFLAVEIGGLHRARIAGGVLGCIGLVMLVGSLVGA